jgi:MFS family permease
MWGAQFVSNIGSWMQTVAAQWLMLTLTSSATYVALVQTAAGLPVVLFAVLAGTIGDLVDRRRFLLVTQAVMLVAAAALGVLAIAGLVTPWVLLALIFAVGTGQALTSPTWQTLQPELVSPAERPQAISLGAVNQNLARAVGPAAADRPVGTAPGFRRLRFAARQRRDRRHRRGRPAATAASPAVR